MASKCLPKKDVMNSIYELSKASHRRSVCIMSMSGYVSKFILRTPNGLSHTWVAAVADEFDCQKQTMPNSGMKQILNIFSLVPCTQLETENFNLKTNKNKSHYSLLLVPFATTIGSWKNAT